MNRETLQTIRVTALKLATGIGTRDIMLMRAWTDLASAADRLDAMLARGGVPIRRAPVVMMNPESNFPPVPREQAEIPEGIDISGFEPSDDDEDDDGAVDYVEA